MNSTSEIPFARDKTHRILPHMLAVLVCFVSLLCAFSSDMYRYVQQQSAQQTQLFYIEIPAFYSMSESDKEQIRTSLNALIEAEATLSKAQWLARDEVAGLLEPWLGKGLPLDTLPLPQLVEVAIEISAESDVSTFDSDAFQGALNEIHAGTQLDQDQPWRTQFAEGGYVLIRIMLFIALALFLVTLSFVALLSRTHFQLHEGILELLRRVGARDAYIIRQFQRHNLRIAMKGALSGSFAGAAMYGVWHLFGVTSMLGIVASSPHWLLPLACFSLLPLLVVLACLLVTHMSVNGQLKESY